jgi:hypothetical protein
MPNIIISKIKARRGTDAQRKHMIFDEGELAYTTDTKRLYVGNGTLSGGVVVGNNYHLPITSYYNLSTVNAGIGDIINVNNLFYQLTASDYSNITSWGNVGTKLNPLTFSYDATNQVTLIPASLSASYLHPSTIGGALSVISGVLQTTFQTNSIELSSGKLSIKASGIGKREISSAALSSGLTGGDDNVIKIKADPSQFYFDGTDTLKLSGLPSAWYGSGLSYNLNTPLLSTTLTDVDNVTLLKTSAGVISQATFTSIATNELSKVVTDVYGRSVSTNAIYGTLSGNSSLSGFNSTNSLSALFNGSPNQALSGALPGAEVTFFTALSSNGATITLSSAGFITFEGNSTTRNGDTVGRFAIPIFSY